MSQLEILGLKKHRSEHLSKEDYKQKVLRAVELLVGLGIMDTPESDDLNSSVEKVIQKLRKDEAVLYGREMTKQEVCEQIEETNAEIVKLEQKLVELRNRLQQKRLSKN